MYNKVVILNFSPRNVGNCSKIAECIADFHNQAEVEIYSINADNFLPCNSCNYECLQPEKLCPQRTAYQDRVMDAIINSNVAYFIVPNFCGYPNANYFAFNERRTGYFNLDRQQMNAYLSVKKKFIIVSNSESDAFKNAIGQQAMGEPEILYLKTRNYGKQSTAGDLMDSNAAKADLKAFIES